MNHRHVFTRIAFEQLPTPNWINIFFLCLLLSVQGFYKSNFRLKTRKNMVIFASPYLPFLLTGSFSL